MRTKQLENQVLPEPPKHGDCAYPQEGDNHKRTQVAPRTESEVVAPLGPFALRD